jgi:hypothetical protein
MSVKYVTVEFIKVIASALDDLNAKFVFVGGSTLPFYLPQAMKATARPTEDIDVVVEIVGRAKKADFEEALRKKGFKNDTSKGAHTNRWKFKEITVDIMGTEEKTFGFTNQWYAEGVENSWVQTLGKQEIKILSLPYFIATKIEAFKSRGKYDFIGSHDIEDIVAVLDMSETSLLEGLLPSLSDKVSGFLKKELSSYLKSGNFLNALPGHISDRVNSDARARAVEQRIAKIVSFLKG